MSTPSRISPKCPTLIPSGGSVKILYAAYSLQDAVYFYRPRKFSHFDTRIVVHVRSSDATTRLDDSAIELGSSALPKKNIEPIITEAQILQAIFASLLMNKFAKLPGLAVFCFDRKTMG